MRRLAATAAFALAVLACGDLLHSTHWETLCASGDCATDAEDAAAPSDAAGPCDAAGDACAPP